MPQDDYLFTHQSRDAERAKINQFLSAIVSNNSAATEPSTTYAYQWWADTTTGLLKIRNAANSAWVTVGTLASTYLGMALAGAIESSGLTIGSGKIAGRSSVSTGALEQLSLSQVLDLIGSAAQGDILYRGASSWSRLGAGTAGFPLITGGAGANPAWGSSWQPATATSVTSGTTSDLSIPSGARCVVVSIINLSTNGASNIIIQLGDSGGVETSGYVSGCGNDGSTRVTSTAGFVITSLGNAAYVRSGHVILTLIDPASNTWAASSNINETGSGMVFSGAGNKSLTSELTTIRLTSVTPDTFDGSGKWNIHAS